MSRIKVIKRAALQSRANAGETEKISRAAVKRAGKEKLSRNGLMNERASKPKDSRQAVAASFGNSLSRERLP